MRFGALRWVCLWEDGDADDWRVSAARVKFGDEGKVDRGGVVHSFETATRIEMTSGCSGTAGLWGGTLRVADCGAEGARAGHFVGSKAVEKLKVDVR